MYVCPLHLCTTYGVSLNYIFLLERETDRQVQPARVLPPGREAVQPALPRPGFLSRPRVRPAGRLRHGHHARPGRLSSRKVSKGERLLVAVCCSLMNYVVLDLVGSLAVDGGMPCVGACF